MYIIPCIMYIMYIISVKAVLKLAMYSIVHSKANRVPCAGRTPTNVIYCSGVLSSAHPLLLTLEH